jgi:hypothetical protein
MLLNTHKLKSAGLHKLQDNVDRFSPTYCNPYSTFKRNATGQTMKVHILKLYFLFQSYSYLYNKNDRTF